MESPHPSRGFSLIELLVVLAIIGILLAIVITSQSTFNKTLTLANTAYDLALTLRSAETFGLGTRTSGSAANVGYGLHFDTASPTSFLLFADGNLPSASGCHGLSPNDPSGVRPDAKPGNCIYDSGETVVSTYTFGNTITISDLCIFYGGSSHECTGPSLGGVTKLDIVFARPNAQAFLSRAAGGSTIYESTATQACIALTSATGGARYVKVYSSGQITANATSCP